MPGGDALLGAAGVYYVAARLNALGYHAALTIRNVPNVDLLASSLDGRASLSIQVKTSRWALRERGRGSASKPHHYEWSMSWKAARLSQKNLFFALVDLVDFTVMPDVFIVPSEIISAYYEGGDPATWKWPRYHETVENLAPYKNAWNLITDYLDGKAATSP